MRDFKNGEVAITKDGAPARGARLRWFVRHADAYSVFCIAIITSVFKGAAVTSAAFA